jgi:phage terminase large subunit GpA-like protein
MATVTEDFLFEDELLQLEPTPKRRILDWCDRFQFNERGEPYNHNAYPHLGAPGGPCDAFDDPYVRTISEMFGTRLGKTFFGQCCICYAADQDPGPMMFVSSVEKLAKEVTRRTYSIMERCRPLQGQLLREDLRSTERIELDHCVIEIGWARSPSTLGDKNAKVGHGSEIDKWERHSTSTEADPLDLFLDRGKDITNHKFILEGTPAVKGTSRIELYYSRSSQSKMYVPCPHCDKYQFLRIDRLRWEKGPDGHSDSDLARRTAHYVCEFCNGQILDFHRDRMMRLGVWVPAGCGIDHVEAQRVAKERLASLRAGTLSDTRPGRFWRQSYLIGEPTRDGVGAGFQLSSLYALSLSWGAIGARWVEAQHKATSLQNFINQWLAETWSPKKEEKDWEGLAKKLIVSVPQFVVPKWASLVFVAADHQKDHYKYTVRAYGPGWRRHTLDYGRAVTLQELYDRVILRTYDYEDSGTLGVSYAVCDYGGDPREPTEISALTLEEADGYPIKLFLCKGDSTKLGTAYRESETGKNAAIAGLPLFLVDSDWTQGELNQLIYSTERDAPSAMSVYHAQPIVHKAYTEELLNEHHVVRLNPRTKEDQLGWQRKDESRPNDLRDCERYADVICLVWLGGDPIPTRGVMMATSMGTGSPARTPVVTMPDGRPYCVLNRN